MSFKLIILAPPTHFPVGLSEFLEAYPDARIEIYHPDYRKLGNYFFAGLVKDFLVKYRQISLHLKIEPEDKTSDLYLEVAEVERSPEEEAKFPINIWPRSRGSLDLRYFLELPKKYMNELWEIQKTHNAVAPFLPHRKTKKEIDEEHERVEKDHGGYDLSFWDEKDDSSPWWQPEEKRDWPKERGERLFYKSLKIPDHLSARMEQKHLELIKDVVCLLMGEKDLSLETMEVLDIATVPEALTWFERFCQENEIKENLISLNTSLQMGCSWAKIKSALKMKK